jgi:hypothetical protein
MPVGKTCGNCSNFIRIKDWGGGRNGLCGCLDYNCNTDSSYAKECKHYRAKKYKRVKEKQNDIN